MEDKDRINESISNLIAGLINKIIEINNIDYMNKEKLSSPKNYIMDSINNLLYNYYIDSMNEYGEINPINLNLVCEKLFSSDNNYEIALNVIINMIRHEKNKIIEYNKNTQSVSNYFYVTNIELFLLNKFNNDKLFKNIELSKKFILEIFKEIKYSITEGIVYYSLANKNSIIKENLNNFLDGIFNIIKYKDELNENEIFFIKEFITYIISNKYRLLYTKTSNNTIALNSLLFDYFNNENFIIKDEKGKKEVYKILMEYFVIEK